MALIAQTAAFLQTNLFPELSWSSEYAIEQAQQIVGDAQPWKEWTAPISTSGGTHYV